MVFCNSLTKQGYKCSRQAVIKSKNNDHYCQQHYMIHHGGGNKYIFSYNLPFIIVNDSETGETKGSLVEGKGLIIKEKNKNYIYYEYENGNPRNLVEKKLDKSILYEFYESEKYTYNLTLFKKKYGIDYIIFLGKNIIDISDAKKMLFALETIMKRKCPNLGLKFDYMYNMTGDITSYEDEEYNLPILCLYKNGNCVSSVQLKDRSDNHIKKMEILFATAPKYQKNKYIRFLISIIIMIGSSIKIDSEDVNILEAYAIVPTSAYLLLKYFNGKVTWEEQYEYLNTIPIEDITYDLINKIYTNKVNINIEIFLNYQNRRLATNIFNELLNDDSSTSIKC